MAGFSPDNHGLPTVTAGLGAAASPTESKQAENSGSRRVKH